MAPPSGVSACRRRRGRWHPRRKRKAARLRAAQVCEERAGPSGPSYLSFAKCRIEIQLRSNGWASSAPRALQFPPQFILPMHVPRREVERDNTRNTRSSCERARLRSGEVAPFGSELRVLLQKHRLDEQLVGTPRASSVIFAIFDSWKAASTT